LRVKLDTFFFLPKILMNLLKNKIKKRYKNNHLKRKLRGANI